MEKCQQLYNRLQQDIKPIVVEDKIFTDETMSLFCLNIMMKQTLIKERNIEIFDNEFNEIGKNFHTFDDKTKKTIWLYFDLFIKVCEKYTKEQTKEMMIDAKNINIESKMSEVSELLEDKLGMKMNAGMEDMVSIIAKEVQKEIKRGNSDMQAIIKNVMIKVIDQFKEKIDNGDIDVDELKQSAEKLMSQIGNPAALFGGMNNSPQKSRDQSRRDRRERLRKKLNEKNKNKN